eukprot:scaffold324287_cov75-Attheya_sp.AAC.1
MRISTTIQPSDSKKATSVRTADGHGWVDAIVVPVPIPISYAQFWEHWPKWHPSAIVVHPSKKKGSGGGLSMTDAAGMRTNSERNAILRHVVGMGLLNQMLEAYPNMLINVLVGSAALTVCIDRSASGALQYTPTLNMVFVGSATLTDCLDRPYGGMWCGVVWCGVVWCGV